MKGLTCLMTWISAVTERGEDMSEIAIFTKEQSKEAERRAKECQFGCTCIICGGFIPIRDPRECITPICINCIDALRKIVLEQRGK